MYGAVRLTTEQYHALDRLYSSLNHRTSVSEVVIGTLMINRMGVGEWYATAEFRSGHGNRKFHIAADGTSCPADSRDNSEFTR